MQKKQMEKNQMYQIQVLANCQGIFFDKGLKKHLQNNFKLVSKNIGIDKSTKNMKDFLIEPYLLDKISVSFLLEEKPNLIRQEGIPEACKQKLEEIKSSLEFRVFKELKQKYFLIEGHKFGSTFLAYDQNPQKNHAKSLIFCGKKEEKHQKFNHMTRLAQIAKKQCLFVSYNEENDNIVIQKLERQKQENTKKNKKKEKIDQKNNQKDL